MDLFSLLCSAPAYWLGLSVDPLEQTTAVTDLLLALTAALIARGVCRNRRLPRDKARLWSAALTLLTLTALLGAVVHGVALGEAQKTALWPAVNAALAATLALIGAAASYDLSGPRLASALPLPALLIALGYAAAGSLCGWGFIAMIRFEAAVLICVLAGYVILTLRGRRRGAGWMAAAVAVSLLAAALQTRHGLRLDLIWRFDHNGVFHLLQIVALLLLGVSLRSMGRTPVTPAQTPSVAR